MFKLKVISKGSIEHALERAERYRLLNEPGQAESICQDILAIDSGNQQALVMLLLALTDRFSKRYSISGTQPEDLLPRLQSEYERVYYAGLILERRGKSKLEKSSFPGAESAAYALFVEAMSCYEKAEALRSAGNDDAVLRWNTCARIIMQNKLTPLTDDSGEQFLE